MNIYVTHSSSYDYQNELYAPLRGSAINKNHQIVLPHEHSKKQYNSKEYLKNCDLVIAEVSLPSTGQGIELGWANLYGVPIICIFKSGTKPPTSIKDISDVFIEYKNSSDMIKKLNDFISKKYK